MPGGISTTRLLAAVNGVMLIASLWLLHYLVQMLADPPAPTEADPDGTKVVMFFIYVVVMCAVFSLAIAAGLWFQSPALRRVAFWVAILATVIFGLILFLFLTISYFGGVVFLPLLAAVSVPLISAFHLRGLIIRGKPT